MNTHSDGTDGPLRGERGAALLEFALIFPIFMTVVLGMFSGGTAYSQKAAMNSAAREGARYAATLPISGFATCTSSGQPQIDCWLHDTATYIAKASEGALGPGVAGWEVCVAYVYAPSSGDQSKHETHVGNAATGTATSGPCPFADDGPADDKPRVQVTTRRTGKIDALFLTHTFTMSTQTITRFEALP